ncbi:MAG: OmpA family protein [Spirosoma sp.]|nr:OmpA family protein [Spirosoma sp.]
MNRLLLSIFLLLASLSQLLAQYVTVAPRVDDVNDRDVSIQRVELTEQYTIIYMKFQRGKEVPQPQDNRQSWPIPIPMPGKGNAQPGYDGSSIGFQPDARLYVNQGEKSFKLIRTENIPPETRRPVSPGERVDFVAYFERIDPGYIVFDLFECKDYVQGMSKITCFNFWGVHITNPKKKDAYAQRTPRPTPIPKPTTQPRYTPRTSPGVDSPAPKAEPAAPDPTSVGAAINGVTRNVKTKKPVAATVTYQLISGAETTGNNSEAVQSVQPSGSYKISDVQRGVYALTVSANGYFSQTDTLATNRVNVTRNFDLVPIEVGAKLTLKNIYFDASKYDLKSESSPELDRLVTVMQNNPRLQIKLEGHTDTVGDFDANVELSRNRVNAVKRYLVSKGIGAGRIDTVGYGPSRPINTNRSLKERPENRRVEMVVVTV